MLSLGSLFHRKQNADADASAVDVSATRPGKRHPTPTRKQAEARHYHPLVPADRSEARKQARRLRQKALAREQQALETGDERYLPARDKGRVRRFARDWLDARWSISEFVMPAMLLFLLAMLVLSSLPSTRSSQNGLVMGMTMGFYGLLLATIVEAFVVWQRLKRRIRRRYPDEPIPNGTWFYVYSRMIMARRWRSPKPQVARGEFPGRRRV